VVLIGISLMTKDVKHFFLYLLAFFVVLHLKIVFLLNFPLLIRLIVVLMFNFLSSLNINSLFNEVGIFNNSVDVFTLISSAVQTFLNVITKQ
jgi:hypothetical protein